MFNSCLNFLIDFFGNVFSFLDSCMLTSTVSILVVSIVFFVLRLVIKMFKKIF